MKWVDTIGATKSLNGVVRNYDDESTAEVTAHPVADGSVVTDHVIQNPQTLTLEIISSNTPISDTPGFSRKELDLTFPKSRFTPRGLLLLTRGAGLVVGAAVSALTGAFGVETPGAAKFTTLQSDGTFVDIINNLHTLLLQLKQSPPDSGVLVSIGGREYNQYLLNRVTKSVSSGSGGLATFAVDLVQFRTVSTASVPLPDPSKSIAKRNKGRGNKPAQPQTDDEADALIGGNQSLLASGADALGGLL